MQLTFMLFFRNDKKYKGKVGALSSSEATTREYVAMFFVAVVTVFLVTYAMHCVWATSEAYSSPSIVLSARSHDGSRIIFDDFREAYWWLRMVRFLAAGGSPRQL